MISDTFLVMPKEKEIETVLGPDIVFEGELSFNESLMIKGKLVGQVLNSGELYIDKDSVVEAELIARKVSVKGTVKGNIRAEEKVELFSTAVINGNINSPCIVMDQGARFNGRCEMAKSR